MYNFKVIDFTSSHAHHHLSEVRTMRRIKRNLRFKVIKILRQKQGAHQISLGFVLGFYPCWFPTFGIGPLLSIGLAKLVKGNIASAILAASLGSFLWPLLFLLNYQIGSRINQLLEKIKTNYGYPLKVLDELSTQYMTVTDKSSVWGQLGVDFLLGFIVNSLFFSLFSYLLIRILIKHYRFPILRSMRNQ
jgi:uncharacterized protein (DUF2062 family)